MRLSSFRACLLASLALLLAGCAGVPVAQMCDPYEPPNCHENPSFVVVRAI